MLYTAGLSPQVGIDTELKHPEDLESAISLARAHDRIANNSVYLEE